ncbi:serine hydrolase [Flavobacterium chilense]|uniref:CubicO group peptidase, beta-lactamase class C family n=1 Tax=Flavobacterium chilense TaxID=946677 RepID=A0A1M7N3K9_9FLAO|nr:serine hydrolase [Flavobacterium chilense]SHM98108.1 CubicO group peptidase, beta-lactamase class C family [Flavobacterium chilense]
MKIKFSKSLLVSFLTILITLTANSQNQQHTDSIDVFLKDKMKKLHIPGLQLAVVQNGKIIKRESYGIANIENAVSVTEESMFSINSCTKAFVGVAVMQLQEEGKLNINDPISKYLDDIPVTWKSLRIKQLFANISGLPNIIDEKENLLADTENGSWEMVKTQPMELFNTGDRFRYNQTGYVIIGRIINKLSGMHFTKFIEERQFKAVGMKQTRFGDSNDIIPHSAGAYTTQDIVNGRWVTTNEIRSSYAKFPEFFRTCTGIISTSGEIAQWIIALENGKLLKQKSSLDVLWQPALRNNGRVGGFNKLVNGYALGWPTVTREEHPAVGPIGGMRSAFFVYPKDDLSIVVLTNLQGANPEWFIDEIAGYYIPDMKEANGFGLSPSVKKLRKELIASKYSNPLKVAENLKKNDSGFYLDENELNDFGYKLLSEGKSNEALKIFKLNVDLYPKSGNTYDSYAETLAGLGNKKEAIKNYKRAFELNPKNLNAQEQVKKLASL